MCWWQTHPTGGDQSYSSIVSRTTQAKKEILLDTLIGSRRKLSSGDIVLLASREGKLTVKWIWEVFFFFLSENLNHSIKMEYYWDCLPEWVYPFLQGSIFAVPSVWCPHPGSCYSFSLNPLSSSFSQLLFALVFWPFCVRQSLSATFPVSFLFWHMLG